MPQPTETLIQQGASKPSTIKLLNSLDEAIEHFEDSETQKVLKKYGFEVNFLMNDLKETKDFIYQIRDGQQTCIDALTTYIETKRSLGYMPPQTFDEQIAECLNKISDSLNDNSNISMLQKWVLDDFRHRLVKHPQEYIDKLNLEKADFIMDFPQFAEPSEEHFSAVIDILQNIIVLEG